jgi:hypothetical protein
MGGQLDTRHGVSNARFTANELTLALSLFTTLCEEDSASGDY